MERDLREEIATLLNSNGGVIHIDINEQVLEYLNNLILKGFNIDISKLVKISSNKIEVKKGLDGPYFYIDDKVVKIVLKRGESRFEKLESDIQNLSFKYLEYRFMEMNKEFDKYGLNFYNKDDKYNNLALFFSDQNVFKTELNIYQTNNKDIILEKKIFEGSILKQIEDVLYYINIINNKIVINGEESREISEIVLKEAILNAFCHKEYKINDNILIDFFEDRVEIYSSGKFINGVKLNESLMNILEKIGVIKNYATGLKIINSFSTEESKRVVFKEIENGVKIVVPKNRTKAMQDNLILKPKNETKKLETNITMIFNVIKDNPNITVKELMQKFNLSKSTIIRALNRLKEKRLISYVGSNRNGYWEIL